MSGLTQEPPMGNVHVATAYNWCWTKNSSLARKKLSISYIKFMIPSKEQLGFIKFMASCRIRARSLMGIFSSGERSHLEAF